MQSILNGHEKVKNVHSVFLVKNGKLVLEEYFYGTHRNHIHHLQSDTKSVISMLIGIAIDKGFIKNVKQPIHHYFPEINPANLNRQKKGITIEHLLMMTPGLQCRDSSRYGWRGLYEMRRSADWTQFMLDLPMAEAPGTRFEYCKGGQWQGKQIISQTWINQSTRAHIIAGGYDYGYQWWRGKT